MFLPIIKRIESWSRVKLFQYSLTLLQTINFPFMKIIAFNILWPVAILLNSWQRLFSLPVFVRLTGFSNIHRVIVIALCCIVLVLLIAVSLLTWRLRRAVNNKREKTPQRHTSDEVVRHDSKRDQHVPEELPYMEPIPGPLQELPRATSNYQSLKGTVTSSAYCNAGFHRGKSNQEDEIYYEIGNA